MATKINQVSKTEVPKTVQCPHHDQYELDVKSNKEGWYAVCDCPVDGSWSRGHIVWTLTKAEVKQNADEVAAGNTRTAREERLQQATQPDFTARTPTAPTPNVASPEAVSVARAPEVTTPVKSKSRAKSSKSPSTSKSTSKASLVAADDSSKRRS